MIPLPPRVVIAGTHSGVGKTSVATGLLAAFTGSGLDVASAKVGPDFIDPGYHAAATGRPGRNLDAWICGADAIAALAARAGAGADLLIVEGVMGLFDGAASAVPGAVDPRRDDASTAHVARLLDAPIILVVDGSSMSGSVAAVVHGFATLDPDVRVAGVILNRVASDGHERLLREAIEPLDIPVLGSLRRDDTFAWRDRHLGLVPVVEHPVQVRQSIAALARTVGEGCDLAAIVRTGRAAPREVAGQPLAQATRADGDPVRIAVAGGKAFSFSYPDNIERLIEAGRRDRPVRRADRQGAAGRACRASSPGVGSPRSSAPSWPTTRSCCGTCARRSTPGCRPGRSAAACSGWPGPSTAGRWRGRSTPTRT